MIILDTSALIEWARGTSLGANIRDLCTERRTTISAITANEFLVGEQKGHPFLERMAIIPFGASEAAAAAELEKRLRKDGRPLGKLDMLIAGTALAHDAELVTTDKAFEAVKGLKTLRIR